MASVRLCLHLHDLNIEMAVRENMRVRKRVSIIGTNKVDLSVQKRGKTTVLIWPNVHEDTAEGGGFPS